MHNLLALPTGTELVEDYRITRVLGAGGFGLTYLAREDTLNRSVTIKEYFPSDFAAREATLSVRPRSQDSEADYGWGLDRFIEEAQTLARFDHPNINRVYRYFRANNTAYIVLQFEEGQSFKSWLAGLGRAPRQAELDAIVGPLLDALDVVHAGNYLHRDIAPDNIIIRKNGAPVLIDFGSARGEMVQLSKTVSALVKPGYSPYEQYGLSGRQQGPWTDIYSLAASLYQAIAGKRPTDAPTRMLAEDYKPAATVALSSYRPQFLAAIDHALKLRVEERPQSIAAWRQELFGTAPGPAAKRPATPPTADKSKPAKRAAAPNGGAVAPAPAPMTPAVAARSADAAPTPARSGMKRRIVRLLEGVAARAEPGERDKPVPKKIAATPQRQLEPPPATRAPAAAAPEPPLQKRAIAPQAAAGSAPPAEPPAQAANARAAAILPDRGMARPSARAAESKPIAPARTSRATGYKLLVGAMLSAIVLSYQDAIVAGWTHIGLSRLTGAAQPASGGSGADARQQIRTASIPSAAPAPAARRPTEVVLAGHRGAVQAVTFVAGGTALASTGTDGTLRLWDVGQATLVRTVEAGEDTTGALAVQGQTAAVGHQDGTVALWDIVQGQRLRTFKRNDASIWSVAFAGDAQRVTSAGHDWTVALWDGRRDGGPLHLFEGHDNAVQAVAYGGRPVGQGGALLVTGSADKTVKLWSATDLSLIRTYRGHRDFVSALAFAPDGAHFASASFDKTVRIWPVAESGSLRTLRGHKGRVTAVGFSMDGHLVASASEDGTVRFWDWRRGRGVRTLTAHAGAVRAVAFSPDGKHVATAGDDGSIRIWDATTLPRLTASRM